MGLDGNDPLKAFSDRFERGLEGVSEKETRDRITAIERTLRDWSSSRKLYGHMFDDILKLKYLHQRYTNYLRWLTWKK